jgi:hypothetical protein
VCSPGTNRYRTDDDYVTQHQVMSSMLGIIFGMGRFDNPGETLYSVMNEASFGHVSYAQPIDRTRFYRLMNPS